MLHSLQYAAAAAASRFPNHKSIQPRKIINTPTNSDPGNSGPRQSYVMDITTTSKKGEKVNESTLWRTVG